MLRRSFHPKSEAYGESLTRCLLGTRVSGSPSQNAVICLDLVQFLPKSFVSEADDDERRIIQ